jgi:negative regulator of flagellin synthesis FlgM
MKVWGEVPKVSQVSQVKNNKVGNITETSSVNTKKDGYSVSQSAKDYQTVMRELDKIPDIREEKVQKLIEKYEAGNYDVSGEDVIDKLLKTQKEKE